jgi:hypothetical protein
MEQKKQYTRNEDMSPDGKLTVYMQQDGDIIVSMWGRGSVNDELRFAQVEFCTLFAGGGRSKHTREALVPLAEAIEKDNEERPIS